MNEPIRIFFTGLLLLGFQLVLAPILAVESTAYPAPYVLFWLMVPFTWSMWLGGGIAIGYGILLDILFPPQGLQTFSGLWVWALRKPLYRLLHPNLPPDWELSTSPRALTSVEFFTYAFPLTLVHHLWYFPLSAWQFSFLVLLRVGLSTSYSFLWEWVIFELFLRKRDVRG